MISIYKRKERREENVSVFHHLIIVKLNSVLVAENIYGEDKMNLKTRNFTLYGK